MADIRGLGLSAILSMILLDMAIEYETSLW